LKNQISQELMVIDMNIKKLDNSLTIPKIYINSINAYLLKGIHIMNVVWIVESEDSNKNNNNSDRIIYDSLSFYLYLSLSNPMESTNLKNYKFLLSFLGDFFHQRKFGKNFGSSYLKKEPSNNHARRSIDLISR